jgi:hypothetical protein
MGLFTPRPKGKYESEEEYQARLNRAKDNEDDPLRPLKQAYDKSSPAEREEFHN